MEADQPLDKDFTEIFCNCYEEYVKSINSLHLNHRNQLQHEISPYDFLSSHGQFKAKIDGSDPSVLLEIPYIHRRRCLTLTTTCKSTLLNFLVNLFTFAKFATTPENQLSYEEKLLGENILISHKEHSLVSANENDLFFDILQELQKDLEAMLDGGKGDELRKEIEELARRPSATMTPMDVFALAMKRCEDTDKDGQPVLNVMDIVQKVSEKITSKMEAGKIDEQTLIRQTMRFMTGLPKC